MRGLTRPESTRAVRLGSRRGGGARTRPLRRLRRRRPVPRQPDRLRAPLGRGPVERHQPPLGAVARPAVRRGSDAARAATRSAARPRLHVRRTRRLRRDDTQSRRERALDGGDPPRLLRERAQRARRRLRDRATLRLVRPAVAVEAHPERQRQSREVETCAILLLDEETNELVPRAALGIEEEVEQGVRIALVGGFAGRIAAEKQPVILDDVDHAHVLNPILREKGIKSMLGVPLVVEGEVRGVLHVGSLHYRAFDEDEVELLQLVADRAALAIEHARLFEAERAARERIEHVQAVTDAALAHLEVNELLRVLLPRIREILSTDTCAVLLLDEQTNELVVRAALGIEEEVGVRVPLGAGFAGRVADEARPMVIDVDEYPVYNLILRQKKLKSMLGVPLLVRGVSLGVLHVGTLTPRRFTQGEVELLQIVAERVAIAIERAQLHEELIQLDQLKLNFVAIASHELRTPATSVYGVLKTLFERGPALNEELRHELLRVGVEQGERLRSLLEELLDLSRLDARAITVEPRPVVLKSALAEVVHGALASSDAVDLDIPDDLAAVVDPLVLERVISNLVANAVRYGAPPIRIVARQRDRHLRVAVEDAGPGVPKELEGRIFDRFARGGGESGHGLGLAIARAYAQAHGGDLIYDARPRGARFELLIPQERNGLRQPA